MTLKKEVLFTFLAILLLSSCASKKPPLEKRLLVRMSSILAAQGHSNEKSKVLPDEKKEDETDRTALSEVTPFQYGKARGGTPLAKKLPFSKSRKVSVSVDEMPLPDFIHHIFSDIFRVNYIVESKIKKSKEMITLSLDKKISEYQLFNIVNNVLKQHKLSVNFKEDVFYVWQDSEVRDIILGIGATANDIPITTGKIQQLIPIKYGDAQNLVSFIPKIGDARLNVPSNENILGVTGSREQIVQIMSIVNILDQPAMRGRYIGLIPVKYWDTVELTGKLKDILIQEGIPATSHPGKKGVYINNLERWGAILVFAAEKEWLKRLKYWVKILDIPIEQDEEQYFLYYPENSKASELGETLEKILGVSKSDKSAVNPPKKGKTTPAKKAMSGGKGILKGIAGGVRFAVDENRNALIIYTAPKSYERLEVLLRKLDVMPMQVLIDASVAEVTLTDSLQYGLEWYFKNTAREQTSLLQTLEGLGLGGGGLNYSLVTDSEKFKLLINALAQEDMVKIIQSPRITVRDGKSASIIVGTEVPVMTSEATTEVGITTSVQYRKTGVSLQVTPSVHARGVVTLEITQEVSEAQANTTSNISSPIILNRTITTEVVAGDGQTVLLGGLIKENLSETVNKVPILGSIPLLGHLFKTTSKGGDRTELVIMITPHVIRSTQQIEEMKDIIFNNFKHIETEQSGK